MLRALVIAASLVGAAVLGVACGSDVSDVPSPGRVVYLQRCASCHGPDRKGVGTNPALPVARMQQLGDPSIRQIVREGKGTMPAVSPALTPTELDALVAFLLSG